MLDLIVNFRLHNLTLLHSRRQYDGQIGVFLFLFCFVSLFGFFLVLPGIYYRDLYIKVKCGGGGGGLGSSCQSEALPQLPPPPSEKKMLKISHF